MFIKAFLKIRQFQVRVGNVLSDIRMQEEGVPQGSVLSVTLFALAINGITSVIPPDVLSTLFVDDLSLSFSASRMAVAERSCSCVLIESLNGQRRVALGFRHQRLWSCIFAMLEVCIPTQISICMVGEFLVFKKLVSWDLYLIIKCCGVLI